MSWEFRRECMYEICSGIVRIVEEDLGANFDVYMNGEYTGIQISLEMSLENGKKTFNVVTAQFRPRNQ